MERPWYTFYEDAVPRSIDYPEIALAPRSAAGS